MPKPNKQKDAAAIAASHEDKDRFFRKVKKTDDCWLYDHPPRSPYGTFRAGACNHVAHRFIKLVHDGAPPDDKPFACHSCVNRNCVNPQHIFWGSHADNYADTAKSVGGFKHRRGERHHKAKLTDERVLEIYKQLGDGATFSSLAAQYKVDSSLIHAIGKKKAWAHVTLRLPDIPRRHSKGYYQSGENHHACKLTNEQVAQIKRQLLNGTSQKDLAIQFNTTKANISCIKTNKRRADVPWPDGAPKYFTRR